MNQTYIHGDIKSVLNLGMFGTIQFRIFYFHLVSKNVIALSGLVVMCLTLEFNPDRGGGWIFKSIKNP
jgi:hypothetical protein